VFAEFATWEFIFVIEFPTPVAIEFVAAVTFDVPELIPDANIFIKFGIHLSDEASGPVFAGEKIPNTF
jgi:hypothetical protein